MKVFSHAKMYKNEKYKETLNSVAVRTRNISGNVSFSNGTDTSGRVSEMFDYEFK